MPPAKRKQGAGATGSSRSSSAKSQAARSRQQRRSGPQAMPLSASTKRQSQAHKRLSVAGQAARADAAAQDADDEAEDEEAPSAAGARGTQQSGKDAAARRLAQDESTNCKLYKHLVRTVSHTPKSIVKTWIQAYRDANDETSDCALTEIVNFAIQLCGSQAVLTVAEATNSDKSHIAQDVTQSEFIIHAVPLLRSEKKLRNRLQDFCNRLVVESAQQGQLLYHDVLFEHWIDWLSQLSMSATRPVRYMAVSIACMIWQALTQICVELSQKAAQIASQQEAEQKKGTKATRAVRNQLDQNADECEQKQFKVHTFLKQCHSTVFVHRYRDVDPMIRCLCLETAGWLLARHSAFYIEKCNLLKYVGWLLSDKDASVRRAALTALQSLFESASKESLERCELFLDRFKQRISDMTCDADAHTATQACKLMRVLLAIEALDAEDGGHIPNLMWDQSHALQESAAGFVYEDMFETPPNPDGTQPDPTPQKNLEDIKQVLALFIKFTPHPVGAASFHETHRNMAQMVRLLWDYLECLDDWETQVKLLLSNEEVNKGAQQARKSGQTQATHLTHTEQLVLLHLLVCCAQRAAGLTVEQVAAAKAGKVTKADQEALVESAQSCCAALLTPLPQLLTVYGSEARHCRVLLEAVRCVSVDSYATLRKKAEFKDTVKCLRKLIDQHSDEAVLDEAAASLRHFCSTQHANREEAESVLNDLAVQLAKSIDETSQNFIDALGDESTDQDTKDEYAASLTSLLQRLCSLQCMQVQELFWANHPLLKDCLAKTIAQIEQQHAPQDRRLESLLLLLLRCSYNDFVGMRSQLQAVAKQDADVEQPEAAEVSRIQNASHTLIAQFETLLASQHASMHLRDAAFAFATDLAILCNGKLSGTKLHEFALSGERLQNLQTRYCAFFRATMEGQDLQHRIEEFKHQKTTPAAKAALADMSGDDISQLVLKNSRRRAAFCATRLIAFDHNTHIGREANLPSTLRHPQLSALMLASYGSNEGDCDDLIKSAQTHLKNVSVNTLLMAQFYALRLLFDNQTPLDEMREFASRFVLAHPINPLQRSFLGFFKASIAWSCTQVPTRLAFLDALSPFIQRSSLQDVLQIAEYFGHATKAAMEKMRELVESDDQMQDEDAEAAKQWAPLSSFAQLLEKKTKGKVLPAAEETQPAASAQRNQVEATPRATPQPRGSRNVTSPGLSPIETRTDLATPIGASAVSRRRNQSAASSLQAVKESEQEDQSASRPSKGNSSKRKRKASTDDDDEMSPVEDADSQSAESEADQENEAPKPDRNEMQDDEQEDDELAAPTKTSSSASAGQAGKQRETRSRRAPIAAAAVANKTRRGARMIQHEDEEPAEAEAEAGDALEISD